MTVTAFELVAGSHAGSGHTDNAASCSHAEFLQGKLHDFVLANFGEAVLREVKTAVSAVSAGTEMLLYFVADAAQVLPVPEGMSAETAVFLPNMETAVSFVMDGQPMIGEQVLVLGQGVVGLLTTALLAQFPLASLVAVDGYSLRREWAQQLRAHHSLDTSLPLLAGFAADLVYELSGNPAALDAAIEAVRYNGRILVGSWYGNKPTTLNLGGKFHRQHLQLISSQVSHIAPQWNGRWDKPRLFNNLRHF